MKPEIHDLLISLHSEIKELRDGMLDRIAEDNAEALYPLDHPDTPTPGYVLEERRILQGMLVEPGGRVLLGKVIADAAGQILYALFDLLDGVTDPEYSSQGIWFGMRLEPLSPTAPSEPPYSLLSAFMETYNEYVERNMKA